MATNKKTVPKKTARRTTPLKKATKKLPVESELGFVASPAAQKFRSIGIQFDSRIRACIDVDIDDMSCTVDFPGNGAEKIKDNTVEQALQEISENTLNFAVRADDKQFKKFINLLYHIRVQGRVTK